MNKTLFLLMTAVAFRAVAAPPVTVSDDDLLKMVKERVKTLKNLTAEPHLVYSRLATLCDRPSPDVQAKENASPHLNKFVRTYVTPAGEAAATGHEATHPPGTVIVKEKLPSIRGKDAKGEITVTPGTEVELFTGMLKREPGFNPAAGDWEFFTVSGDAGKITSRGKLESCINCHRDYAKSDCVSRAWFEPVVVQPGADGTILLHAKDAEVYGKMLRYEPKPEKNTLGYWTQKDDYAQWMFASKGGTYEVEVLQGCGTGSGGANVEIRARDGTLQFTVEDTGHFQNFKPRIIGKLTVPAGNIGLTVKPQTKPGAAVMDLRSITLRKVNP